MNKLPQLFCEGCNKEIPNRADRNTNFCSKCVFKFRCKDCGRMTSPKTEHICNSVDHKGERFCNDCNKLLSNTGPERWRRICPKCDKKRWRDKERAERQSLREQFGGKCSRCNYDRCMQALHFHHLDSSEKYEWNVKGKGGASLREIKQHPERFQLLCANCHIEIHQSN